MILFLSIIIIVLLAWVIFKPTWAPDVPSNPATQAIDQGAETVSKTGVSFWKRTTTLFTKKSRKQAAAFAAWLQDGQLTSIDGLPAEHVKKLNDWFKQCSNGELNQFWEKFSAFCDTHALDAAWLFEENVDPELRLHMAETLLHFGLAADVCQSANALALFKAWQTAPKAPAYRPFMIKLFEALCKENLAQLPPGLLLANENERLDHIISAITAANQANPDKVKELIKNSVESPTLPAPVKKTKKKGTSQ